jgi:hypothetical protein
MQLKDRWLRWICLLLIIEGSFLPSSVAQSMNWHLPKLVLRPIRMKDWWQTVLPSSQHLSHTGRGRRLVEDSALSNCRLRLADLLETRGRVEHFVIIYDGHIPLQDHITDICDKFAEVRIEGRSSKL